MSLCLHHLLCSAARRSRVAWPQTSFVTSQRYRKRDLSFGPEQISRLFFLAFSLRNQKGSRSSAHRTCTSTWQMSLCPPSAAAWSGVRLLWESILKLGSMPSTAGRSNGGKVSWGRAWGSPDSEKKKREQRRLRTQHEEDLLQLPLLGRQVQLLWMKTQLFGPLRKQCEIIHS